MQSNVRCRGGNLPNVINLSITRCSRGILPLESRVLCVLFKCYIVMHYIKREYNKCQYKSKINSEVWSTLVDT